MITRVEVDGYRLLDGFTADFDRLNVVIGANASGKSTLMDLILFIVHSVNGSLREVVEYHGGMYSISNACRQEMGFSWKLQLQKPTFNPWWKNVLLEEGRDYVYEVRIGTNPVTFGEPVPVFERLYETGKDLKEPSQIFLEDIDGQTAIYDPKRRELIPFDDKRALSDATRGGEPSAPPGAEPPRQDRSLRLAQMRFPNEYPIPSLMRTLIANFAFYPSFEVGKFANIRQKPSDIQVQTALFSNGENLGAVLHELLTRFDYRSQADDLKQFLKSAYPSFIDVTAETAYGGTPPKVLVRLREKGMARAMELWDMSDGMLRFLCLAAALSNPVPPLFIAIDEPEAGFHPRLLPIIADMIKGASERSQILVTTHSPELISRFNLEDIAVMMREEGRAVWRRPRNRRTLKTLLESVKGETLGDLLKSGELEATA